MGEDVGIDGMEMVGEVKIAEGEEPTVGRMIVVGMILYKLFIL